VRFAATTRFAGTPIRTGPASPRRTVRALEWMSFYYTADRELEQIMKPLLSTISRYFRGPERTGRSTLTGQRKIQSKRLSLENLEDRRLMTVSVSVAGASINEISNVSPFIASGTGGLSSPQDLVIGPNGNVYVASNGTNSVIRYTFTGQLLGTFVAANSGGLFSPYGLAFGPDGNLYVDSTVNNAIYEYSGSTGAFLNTFVTAGSGGLNNPQGMVFGQDGNLYVSSTNTQSVLRFQGPTGAAPGSPLPAAGESGATFVASGAGGLANPHDLVFGPNGNLFVTCTGPADDMAPNAGVLEFDGASGNFVTTFVANGEGGLAKPIGLAFDQVGRLYVGDGNWAIHRYNSQGQYIDDPVNSSATTDSQLVPFGMVFNSQGALLVSSRNINAIAEFNSGVLVTLSAPSSSPVSVQYATSDGTAIAGTDYTAQSGTVTLAPGQTSFLIPLVTLADPLPISNDYFNVTLSNPTGGATIANGNAVVTIVQPTWPQVTVSNVSAIEGDTTAHYRGAFALGTPYNAFNPVTFGPDGNLYAAVGTGPTYNSIGRYNGTTGAFMGTFATGPINGARDIVFNNGYMYVASENTNQVLQYNATTGAFVSVFVTAGISGPYGMAFGPDGNLYVSGRESNNVVRYNGATGALLGTFVAAGSGGLDLPEGITFDPSGSYLYVASSGGANEVLKYNAQTGAYVGLATSVGVTRPTDVKFGADGLLYVLDAGTGSNRILRFTENGTYVDDYIPAGSSGMSGGQFMTFGPNGDLYVGTTGNSQILQFGTENEALFTVSLSTALAMPVTVNYTTGSATDTAIAGTNYTAATGTFTFAAGITSETIRVPILDSGSQTTSLTLTLNLSSLVAATLSNSQAVGTILPSNTPAQFYVVNDSTPAIGGTNMAYEYQASGAEQAPFGLSLNNLSPRGVAANAAGTNEWVVDANKNIYVYSSGGTLLGSWSAGGLSSNAQLTGIATDGTNIWLVDSYTDKVYKFSGAASRLSGSQNAASSFSLAGGRNGDTNPQDIVTDGTSFWIVDGSKLKVFKYTLTGSLLGSWAIDPADKYPTGITINPNNASDIWIVDNGTDMVYQYIGAASRTSGSEDAGATFALASGNTNPQGIADPPAAANRLATPQTVFAPIAQATNAALQRLAPAAYLPYELQLPSGQSLNKQSAIQAIDLALLAFVV